MKKPRSPKWILFSALVGTACGAASALFLAALDVITRTRDTHPWLLSLLPIGGLIVGGVYHAYGRKVESGNHLIIEEFHDPQAVIPFRMAPLVLFGTLATHLFGGSAGREGTAVQMGGSIADQFTHILKPTPDERRMLLMAGMSAGFGSVFGVPFAGMVFGIEVLAGAKLHLWSVMECLFASVVAHDVALALGVHHTEYVHPAISDFTLVSGLAMILAGVIFGGVARVFVGFSHSLGRISRARIPFGPYRALIGGAILSALYFQVPTLTRYAGLGIPLLVDSLKTPLPSYDWLGKLVMTVLTLGSGFKGGEVTPLLFVGATLGNALSGILPLSLPLLAATGFVAVFAGAANTPLTCTVMAMELFGLEIALYAALACFASYAVSGPHSIYRRIYRAAKTRSATALHE